MAENNVPAARAVAAPRATNGLGAGQQQQTLVPTVAAPRATSGLSAGQQQQTLLPTVAAPRATVAAPVPAAQATNGVGVESRQQTLLPTAVAEEKPQQTLLPTVAEQQPQQALLPTVPRATNGLGAGQQQQTLLPTVMAEEQPQQTLLSTVGRSDDDDSAAAGFDFIENEQNLAMPPLTADSISERWLRQAADWRTYWDAAESLGEQAAEYKFAYDEGKLGDFEAKSFAKETLKAGVRSLGADSLRAAGNVFAMFGANLENRGAVSAIATAGAGLALPEAGKIRICGKTGERAFAGAGGSGIRQ